MSGIINVVLNAVKNVSSQCRGWKRTDPGCLTYALYPYK